MMNSHIILVKVRKNGKDLSLGVILVLQVKRCCFSSRKNSPLTLVNTLKIVPSKKRPSL